ncbi:hypothetical protein ONZ43_g4529 [Nemania bipapillata]|uniref:Uncharacterized protein n=1 Tax=Nemania bipapillata TaxID=110536 RepID=A0ACC2ILF5_9PEZI|nr:hypothetical protein ONZ43_g4529 [Nemania bipapillata]
MSQTEDADRNEGYLTTMYLQPNAADDFDYHGLPTMLSTRDETIAAISCLPTSAHIHYTVMVPRDHSQCSTATVRLDANKKQIDAAKEEVADYEQILERLNNEADKDPKNASIRDRYLARHGVRIYLLKYMIHFGESIACAPENQVQQRAQPQRSTDVPPPYTP